MQEIRHDGTVEAPELFSPEKMARALTDSKTEEVLAFRAWDAEGKPTRAMRRAWRRHLKK